MANLAEAVDATETDWIISAELSDAIDYLTVESEVVKVTANFPAQRDPQTRIMQVPRIRVERGAGGTAAVSHADATALTPLIPPASSGGGAGVPDPSGAPDGQTIVTVAEEYALEIPTSIQNADGSVVAVAAASELLVTAGNDTTVRFQSDGTIIISNAGGNITITPDGAIAIGGVNAPVTVNTSIFDEDGSTSLAAGVGVFGADGAVDIGPGRIEVSVAGAVDIGNGSLLVAAAGAGITLAAAVLCTDLPTADPVVAGALWIDTAAGRVIKVSTG